MGDRPGHLAPGTPLGEHYTIEGLVRLAEGRMFYLANDNRVDKPTKKCWECGSDDTPRSSNTCAACGAAMRDQRFLVSARWDTERFLAYESFYALKLEHPGLAGPVDVFRHEGQLFSVRLYQGEGLMLDEASPLPNKRVLHLGQRIAGVLAFLRQNGVVLANLTRANLLIHPDGEVSMFDLDIEAVRKDVVEVEEDTPEFPFLGDILRRYCDVESVDLAGFFEDVQDGQHATPVHFGRAVEAKFADNSQNVLEGLLGGMSDVGLTRQLNEDNWGWCKLSDRARLYVVADGMGGHDSGEVASAMAVTTICRVACEKESSSAPPADELEQLVEDSFQTANNTIKETAIERGTDMGTTMVCTLVVDTPEGSRLGYLANVGDSRGYLLRDGALHQISKDHSLVQKMVERGRITAEEARHHPHSNILLRTVGTEKDIDIDIFRVELQTGDKILMCSDGLWGEVEDRDIESLMNTYTDPRIAARELVRASHHGGGKDNVTLVIVTV